MVVGGIARLTAPQRGAYVSTASTQGAAKIVVCEAWALIKSLRWETRAVPVLNILDIRRTCTTYAGYKCVSQKRKGRHPSIG